MLIFQMRFLTEVLSHFLLAIKVVKRMMKTMNLSDMPERHKICSVSLLMKKKGSEKCGEIKNV